MSGLTHAGGVVYRRGAGGGIEVLLVRASTSPYEWVLPKGHIEQGETPEAAARREIMEEAGVVAVVRRPLETTEFSARDETVRAAFFLMSYETSRPPEEDREIRWCPFESALRLTPFDNLRTLLRSAKAILETEKS